MKRCLFAIPVFAITLGAGMLASCGGAYVGTYYASAPPPPLRAEAYGPTPGPGFVWINGYWGSQGGRYEWVPGRWDRPPHGRTRWEAGRWEPHGSQYRFRQGRWVR